MTKNVIIFGADMSSSVHIDNRRKYILVFDKRPKQGLHNTRSCQNGKNLASIMTDSATVCDEIIDAGKNKRYFKNHNLKDTKFLYFTYLFY